MKYLFLLSSILLSQIVFGTETSPSSSIQKLISYSEYGGGDVVVVLEENGTTCTNGYFLKKTDSGFDANLAMLLSAYHAKSPLRLDAHTSDKWDGSTGYYCHVYSIAYGF